MNPKSLFSRLVMRCKTLGPAVRGDAPGNVKALLDDLEEVYARLHVVEQELAWIKMGAAGQAQAQWQNQQRSTRQE